MLPTTRDGRLWKSACEEADARAAQAEAEVARLRAEVIRLGDFVLDGQFGASEAALNARDAAVLAASACQGQVARLTAALAEAEATASLLRKDNERLRWRHPAVLPDWNDLPDGLRAKLARAADGYDPDWGGDLAVNMYATLRQAMMEAPHADN